MTYRLDMEAEPWRFDFFAAMRRIERTFKDRPRIGDSAARREEYVLLGQDPFLDFPASNLSKVEIDAAGRLHVMVKFLGLLGPQGALPVTTTEEAYGWMRMRDDAFPRFLDILNHRFLQFFFRAWADARPVAQHDRPDADRFHTYIGAMIGIGSPPFRDLDTVPDLAKLAFAGLMAPQTKSASRLKSLISGLFGVEAEIDEYVGSYLALDESEHSLLGKRGSALGVETVIGRRVYSVQDKIRIRIHVKSLAEYESFLPSGKYCEPLADAVYFYIGDQLDWDVELALPAGEAPPAKLGRSGRLGWTGWMSPNWSATDKTELCDARFHLANRRRAKRRLAS